MDAYPPPQAAANRAAAIAQGIPVGKNSGGAGWLLLAEQAVRLGCIPGLARTGTAQRIMSILKALSRYFALQRNTGLVDTTVGWFVRVPMMLSSEETLCKLNDSPKLRATCMACESRSLAARRGLASRW